MHLTHPLLLVEIQERIAQYLDTNDLLACTLVCHLWSRSFLPALWRSVVASPTGPDFLDPQNQPLIRHIRHLDVRLHPSNSPLPSRFTHLTSLKISPVDQHPLNDEHTLWTPLTEIVHTLSNGLLSSIELCRHAGTISFWNALSTCTGLNSIKLSNLALEHHLFVPFWRAASIAESIHLRNATARARGHPFQPIFRKRFFRLKHLVLEGESAVLWTHGRSLPWLRAPNLETIRCSGGHWNTDLCNLALEIGHAHQAAAVGQRFYGRGGAEYDLQYIYYPFDGSASGGEIRDRTDRLWDGDPEEMAQYCGLVPGRKIRALECLWLEKRLCGEIKAVIENMDELERFVAHRLYDPDRIVEALWMHVETLVEVDLWQCRLSSADTVRFLQTCPRLQVFGANKLDTATMCMGQPWVCVGLRQLNVQLMSRVASWKEREVSVLEQEVVLQRLAGLPALEFFFMPKYWHLVTPGLERLKGLRKVRDVWFVPESINKLKIADAEWMVQHWPDLKMVHVLDKRDLKDIPVAVKVLGDHGVSVIW